MKKIIAFFLSFLPMIFLVSPAFAAATSTNPNVVAYYNGTLDKHAIPIYNNGPTFLYETGGSDLVMADGQSGNFQQWWWNDTLGYHSVWNMTKNGKCPDNAVLVPNAYPVWGDYLVPGADYCVITNQFSPPPTGLYGWQ